MYSTGILPTSQEMEDVEEREYENWQFIQKQARTIQVADLCQFMIDMKKNLAKELEDEFQVISFVPFVFS